MTRLATFIPLLTIFCRIGVGDGSACRGLLVAWVESMHLNDTRSGNDYKTYIPCSGYNVIISGLTNRTKVTVIDFKKGWLHRTRKGVSNIE